MKARASTRRYDSAQVVGAGAASGSIGTIIAATASALPPTSTWKPVLLVAAPLISVFIGGIWLLVKAVYLDPFLRSRKEDEAVAAMDRILDKAHANKSKVMHDPHTSVEHKQAVARQVEQLEEIRLGNILKRMEVLALDEH